MASLDLEKERSPLWNKSARERWKILELRGTGGRKKQQRRWTVSGLGDEQEILVGTTKRERPEGGPEKEMLI
jgi:hypothetical protein